MGSVNPHPLTKTAFWLGRKQDHVLSHLSESHNEVLYQYGEYVVLVMLWHVRDFEAGLVERCHTCSNPGDATSMEDRIAKAYGYQSDIANCPDCFGTSYEGGYRARVIRPAIVSDTNTETSQARRGEITTDTIALETTSDIYLRTGDYIFRADNSRYRTAEMSTLVLRTGFDVPEQQESIGGVIPQAKLEDPTSVAYLIPPAPADINALLNNLSLNRHIPTDVTALDVLNGPLIP